MRLPDPKQKALPAPKARWTQFQHCDEILQEAQAHLKSKMESKLVGRTCHIKKVIK